MEMEERVREVLDRITYAGQKPLRVGKTEGAWFLQVRLLGHPGRKWMLSEHMTDSELVQTAFKACLAWEEHECRESFLYRGQRVFGPHFDVDVLSNQLARLGDNMLDVRDD